MQEGKSLGNKLFISIAAIIIGIVLIIWQRSAGVTIIRVTGYIMVAAGILYLIMYFTRGRDESLLVYAISAIGGGLLIALLAHLIVDIFPIIMGVLMMMNGATAMSLSLRNKHDPWYMLILYAALIALGILIILNPVFISNMLYLFIGISFVVSGVTGLLSDRMD